MVITRSPRSRVHLAVLLATCLLLGLGVAQGRAATRSVYFGAYVNLTNKWTKTARVREIRAYQHALGRRLAINHRYYGWSADLANWETRWDVAKGRRPLLSWSHYSARAVASGSQDALIRRQADRLRALGKPVFLEWFWEMDLHRYDSLTGSPATFITAWRHLHDVFHAQGASNVRFVWCPTAAGFQTGDAQRYYPGDRYVDWVCADGYNWGNVHSSQPWRSFVEIFRSFYHWGSTATAKPLMVGETGTAEGVPGQKASWFAHAARGVHLRFPRLKAVVYFDSNDASNHWDWRTTSSASARSAFITWAGRTYFRRLPR
jgi:Glycosyl hydrolase family 26